MLSFVIAQFSSCVHVTKTPQHSCRLIHVCNHPCYSDKDLFCRARWYFVSRVQFHFVSWTLSVPLTMIIPPSEWFKLLSAFSWSGQNPSELQSLLMLSLLKQSIKRTWFVLLTTGLAHLFFAFPGEMPIDVYNLNMAGNSVIMGYFDSPCQCNSRKGTGTPLCCSFEKWIRWLPPQNCFQVSRPGSTKKTPGFCQALTGFWGWEVIKKRWYEVYCLFPILLPVWYVKSHALLSFRICSCNGVEEVGRTLFS